MKSYFSMTTVIFLLIFLFPFCNLTTTLSLQKTRTFNKLQIIQLKNDSVLAGRNPYNQDWFKKDYAFYTKKSRNDILLNWIANLKESDSLMIIELIGDPQVFRKDLLVYFRIDSIGVYRLNSVTKSKSFEIINIAEFNDEHYWVRIVNHINMHCFKCIPKIISNHESGIAFGVPHVILTKIKIENRELLVEAFGVSNWSP